MGITQHHAIIITGGEGIDEVYAFAKRIEACVGSHPGEVVNGYKSFVVFPDGSKHGWGVSNDGDHRRDSIIRFIGNHKRYLKWVEVEYGELGYSITRSSERSE